MEGRRGLTTDFTDYTDCEIGFGVWAGDTMCGRETRIVRALQENRAKGPLYSIFVPRAANPTAYPHPTSSP